jgi:hypothetical protein
MIDESAQEAEQDLNRYDELSPGTMYSMPGDARSLFAGVSLENLFPKEKIE